MDNFIRSLLLQAVTSTQAACRFIPEQLEPFIKTASTPALRKQVEGWTKTLREADRSRAMTEASSDDDFRFRTDIADALCGAADLLGRTRPQLPDMILKLLSLTVVMSAHIRLQTQAQIGNTPHDKEAAALVELLKEQMQRTGLASNPVTRTIKQRSATKIADWLESSSEDYDRRLAASLRFIARNLPT